MLARAVKTSAFRSILEKKFSDLLTVRVRSGDIEAFFYEPFRFRLAKNTYYTVDFVILHTDRTIECVEVKGHHKNIRESRAKWKIAAAKYPFFRWTFTTWKQGRWVEEHY
jgi:hypothetical protein